MASEEAAVAKIALDLHAELGPPKQKRRQTISRNERRRDEARLVFNKIITGHYRDAGNDYSQVGALFVTWEANDLQLNGKDSEVNCVKLLCIFCANNLSRRSINCVRFLLKTLDTRPTRSRFLRRGLHPRSTGRLLILSINTMKRTHCLCCTMPGMALRISKKLD